MAWRRRVAGVAAYASRGGLEILGTSAEARIAAQFPAWEPRDFFSFEVIHRSRRSNARVGRIHTPHGIVDTPGFVAVGTNGALKAVDHNQILDEMDPQLMFCNTYHLLLQPGTEVIKAAGGLHRFMNRTKPLITDSGGFQVFSLASNAVTPELNRTQGSKYPSSVISISEEGVVFRSYRDGAHVSLTPESSVEAQKAFGADIIIPLGASPHHTHLSPPILPTQTTTPYVPSFSSSLSLTPPVLSMAPGRVKRP